MRANRPRNESGTVRPRSRKRMSLTCQCAVAGSIIHTGFCVKTIFENEEVRKVRYFWLVIAALWIGLVVALWRGGPNPTASATATALAPTQTSAPSRTPTATRTHTPTKTATPTVTATPMLHWRWEGRYRSDDGRETSVSQTTELLVPSDQPYCLERVVDREGRVFKLLYCEITGVDPTLPTETPRP